ncbi:MAG: GGDEF domain-containing protein [Gemmatimonadetes bacterium]|nr:GGDEF domain-containing protein [Gemmatimonadota bacterium]
MDIDGFKPVNDQHGHAAGDQMLADIARRLQRCLRKTDTVSRLGGDEFALLLDPSPPTGDTAKIAAKLLTGTSGRLPAPPPRRKPLRHRLQIPGFGGRGRPSRAATVPLVAGVLRRSQPRASARNSCPPSPAPCPTA